MSDQKKEKLEKAPHEEKQKKKTTGNYKVSKTLKDDSSEKFEISKINNSEEEKPNKCFQKLANALSESSVDDKKYREEDRKNIAFRILNEKQFYARTIEEIAEMLNVHKTTLYRWSEQDQELRNALTRAKQRYINKITGYFEQYVVTEKGQKFSGGDLLNFLKLMGFSREIPGLRNQRDELKALESIQDSLAHGLIDPQYAESCTKVIMCKIEAKKELDWLKRLEAIESKLQLSDSSVN